MSDNIVNLDKGIDRPLEVSLMDAIEYVIEEIAVGRMTHVEIVGTLEMIKAKYTSHIVEHYLSTDDY
jgi:hypothetical protein